jgi:uncharacterized protein YecT (DUF1311 family)
MIRRLSSILCLRDLMGRIQAPQTPSYPPPSSYPPPAYQPTSPHSPPAQPRPPQPTADRRLVTEAQQLLSRLGYDIGLVDGTTGDRTTAAVRAFQNDVGQPATGRISTATVAALRARVANLAAASGYDPGTNNSAAADCRHAASPVERMICTQPRLAEADAKLGLAYTAARAAADAQAQRDLTLEQRAWLRQRDACGPNPTCLERSMTARIAELTQVAEATLPANAPVPAADTAPPPPPPAPTGRASTPPGLAGSWSGHFDCMAPRIPLSLTITEQAEDLIEAEVGFTMPQGGPAAYLARGRYSQETNEFRLAPTRWIERPQNVTALGIQGKMHGSGRSIAGNMIGCMTGQAAMLVERPLQPGDAIAAAEANNPTPLSGGPLHDEWVGSAACTYGQNTLTSGIRLNVLQDGRSVAIHAILANPQPRPGQPEDTQFIVYGTPQENESSVSMSAGVNLSGQSTVAMPRSFTADVDSGALSVQFMQPGCRTSLRRAGPPRIPPLPSARAFEGHWAGQDYHVASNLYEQTMQNVRTGGSIAFTQVQFLIARQGAELLSELRATAPHDKPPAQQDHFTTSLSPILTKADGRIVLTPVGRRRAEGIFLGTRGGPGFHQYTQRR